MGRKTKVTVRRHTVKEYDRYIDAKKKKK